MINEILVAGLLFLTPAVEKDKADPFILYEATCLAKNMYYEARNQGTAGRLAVSNVVLNRVDDKRFPNTVCEVVEQGPVRESWKKNGVMYPIRHTCQFSRFWDGKSDEATNVQEYEQL